MHLYITLMYLLFSNKITKDHISTYECNSGMNVMGLTNFFPIGFKAHSRGGNACLILQMWPTTHS